MKKKRVIGVLLAVLSILVGACSGGGKDEVARLNAQIDSLERASENHKSDMDDIMSFVNTLAEGLDSIAQREDMLFYSNKGPEGTYVDREQLKKNLELFETTLKEQRERIGLLVDSLNKKGQSLDKMKTLVAYLNKQLDEKNDLIASLRKDLNNKDLSIAQLKNRMKTLSDTNSKLSRTVETQREALVTQSDIINECYVKIGTKKQLSDLGILSGGFLKKKKVDVNNINKDQFVRVDIRTFTEVSINSPNPKILTQMPASSYRIENHGSTSTLYVLDPTAFWSVSNYLVIQTK